MSHYLSRESQKERARAHAAVHKALRRREIRRPRLCSACGRLPPRGGRIVAHHDDYDVPLRVRWLCDRCHGLEKCVGGLRHQLPPEVWRKLIASADADGLTVRAKILDLLTEAADAMFTTLDEWLKTPYAGDY